MDIDELARSLARAEEAAAHAAGRDRSSSARADCDCGQQESAAEGAPSARAHAKGFTGTVGVRTLFSLHMRVHLRSRWGSPARARHHLCTVAATNNAPSHRSTAQLTPLLPLMLSPHPRLSTGREHCPQDCRH